VWRWHDWSITELKSIMIYMLENKACGVISHTMIYPSPSHAEQFVFLDHVHLE